MLFFRRLFSTKTISPVDQLDSIYKLSLAVNGTPSTIEKQAILNKFPASHSTLKRIYDPHLRHYVSSKKIIDYLNTHPIKENAPMYTDLNELLDALSTRSVTGHAAYDSIANFYRSYCLTEDHRNIFWRILDRNLKMGVSVKTIRHLLSPDNKAISTKKESVGFNVALATSFSSTTKKSPFNISDGWYVSQKLDGIRCIAMIRSIDDIQFYSRTGRCFNSLQKVKLDIQHRLKSTQNEKNEFVLDGEICAYNEDNNKNENFLKAMGEIRRQNEEMENPVYQVFDYIQLQSFLNSKSDQLFTKRQELLRDFIGHEPLPHMKLVEQTLVENKNALEVMEKEAIEKGWEGLILRKDVSYEGKRTRNMIKIKEWEDAEYIVKSIETGLMRMPNTGEDKLVVTNVNIEHKGNTVSVGSGFSMHSRISFAEDPSKIIGKPITVRYFSESKKENGAISLRFPSVKAIYEEGKRDI